MHLPRFTLTLALCLAPFAVAPAGPLTEAQVTKIINDVRVVDPARGSHPAVLDETIKDSLALKTGVKSRSELRFQDQTLTRLGPETSFSFKAGTRDMSLEEGTMLLQVPKGHGGARIRTAAVTAAITGTTIMMEYRPNKSIKVLVLEGSLRLSVNGRFGDSLLLLPGKMVIMPPNAKRIPEPVSVDLAKVVKTSALVKMGKSEGDPLPSMGLIDQEIAAQSKDREDGKLIDTNLLIAGAGTDVQLQTDAVVGTLARKDAILPDQMLVVRNSLVPVPDSTPVPSSQEPGGSQGPGSTPSSTPGSTPSSTPGSTPSSTPSSTPGSTPSSTPGSTPAPTASPGTTPAPTATPAPSATPTATPSATPAGSPVVITRSGDLTISTPITASAITLNVGGKLTIAAPILTGTLDFNAGKDSRIDSTITANTVNGRVTGDLDINRSLNATNITLDLTKQLKYSTALVAPAQNGTLTLAPAAGRHLTMFAESFDLKSVGDDEDGDNDDRPGDSENSPAITLNGGDANLLSGDAGGSGGTLNLGTAARPIEGPIEVKTPISATTGRNALTVAHGGDGGSVSLVSNDKIKVESQIKVSDSAPGRASRKGGNIVLDSRKTSSAAIEIKSSAELLALLSNAAPGPGGTITITSAGGEIKMEGTARADRGTVNIRNTGNAGLVTLKNATLHGDVVKVGALGNNGTLTIGGGSINADSTIKLFAGGSNGTVIFTDNVTLSGNSVKTIAGNTVTIVNGKIVTVTGPSPANVFTNLPNYTGSGGNGSTTGTFGGQGATTQPLSAGPGY